MDSRPPQVGIPNPVTTPTSHLGVCAGSGGTQGGGNFIGQASHNAAILSGPTPDQRVATQAHPITGTTIPTNFLTGLPMVDEDQPLSTQELNLLIKLLQTVGDFPKLDYGSSSNRAERLRNWKHAMQVMLAGTRPIVLKYWFKVVQIAEERYNQ